MGSIVAEPHPKLQALVPSRPAAMCDRPDVRDLRRAVGEAVKLRFPTGDRR